MLPGRVFISLSPLPLYFLSLFLGLAIKGRTGVEERKSWRCRYGPTTVCSCQCAVHIFMWRMCSHKKGKKGKSSFFSLLQAFFIIGVWCLFWSYSQKDTCQMYLNVCVHFKVCHKKQWGSDSLNCWEKGDTELANTRSPTEHAPSKVSIMSAINTQRPWRGRECTQHLHALMTFLSDTCYTSAGGPGVNVPHVDSKAVSPTGSPRRVDLSHTNIDPWGVQIVKYCRFTPVSAIYTPL